MIFILSLSQIFCDDYLNVKFSWGFEYANLDYISKINFSSNGSEINFVLTSGSTSTRTIADIVKMVFGTEAQSDVSLPVELVSFTAIRESTNTVLTWETASEITNYGFEVERIYLGIDDWQMIVFVEGNGSVTTSSEYSFTDQNISQLIQLKYRLKQIDYSGSFAYSPEIAVECTESILPDVYKLYNNYPNPFNPTTQIKYDLIKEGMTSLIIYDLAGKEMEVLVNENQSPGNYTIQYDGSPLASGVYFCRISSGQYSHIIKLVLVQ